MGDSPCRFDSGRPHQSSAHMRIGIDATPADLIPALEWIGAFVGADVEKRIAAFDKQAASAPALLAYLKGNHAIEYALAEARRYSRQYGTAPQGPQFDRLYSFLVPAQRIHSQLDPRGRRAFEGKLRDFINARYGVRALEFEISIAVHLMSRGWDVTFTDLCGVAQFDFLAAKGESKVEIECKTTTLDSGRKIHQQEVHRLLDMIQPALESVADSQGCHILQLTLPDRLEPSNDELAEIAALVSDVARDRCSKSIPNLTVEYRLEAVSEWPDPNSDPNALKFFEALFGRTNGNTIFVGKSGYSVVAVQVVSSKPDRLVEAIANQAKAAADQCSGKLPSAIAIQFADYIGESELTDLLQTASGIHRIAAAVFDSPRRLHVDSIFFAVPQQLGVLPDGVRQFSGRLAALYNPSPAYSCLELRTIFTAKS